jgi:hypothetical protein
LLAGVNQREVAQECLRQWDLVERHQHHPMTVYALSPGSSLRRQVEHVANGGPASDELVRSFGMTNALLAYAKLSVGTCAGELCM